MLRNIHRMGLVLTLLITLSGTLSAHTFWLDSSEQGAHLFLGDASDDERYSEESVGKAGAKAAAGQMEVTKSYDHGHLQLIAPEASVLWVEADYGLWVKTPLGWQEGSKKDGGRIRDSVWHLQYAKLLKSYDGPSKVGLPLEIVLTEVNSEKLKGVVYFQGAPMKSVPLYLGHKKVARTDSSGEFEVKRNDGTTVLSAILKKKLENNEDADHQILTSTITVGNSI